MYNPRRFREHDPALLTDLIERYGFATLISWGSGEPMVTHLPLILERPLHDPLEGGTNVLLGHVARANDHWRRFDGAEESLAIFHGPHAYISPSWYESAPNVPTWSYVVVHVYGRPRLVGRERTGAILRAQIEAFESGRTDRWDGVLPAEFFAEELDYLVAFEMPIERIDGKFKLGQNKTGADRAAAFHGLETAPEETGRDLAAFAREYFDRRKER